MSIRRPLTDGPLTVEGRVHEDALERARAHSNRFRRVSTRYPRRVAEAYDGDLLRAMRDSDEEVAATVADCERAQGLEPRDWHAIGAGGRDETEVRGDGTP